MIAGVCQGFANHFGWDVTLLRVIAVIIALITIVLGVLIYLILWLVIPEEPFPAQGQVTPGKGSHVL